MNPPACPAAASQPGSAVLPCRLGAEAEPQLSPATARRVPGDPAPGATTSFWSRLDGLTTGRALLVDWRTLFGPDFAHLVPFLHPTGALAGWYPCPRTPPCECTHDLRPYRNGRLLAVCTCRDGDCDAFELDRHQVIIHALDRAALAAEAGRALGLRPAEDSQPSAGSQAAPAGLYAPLHAPAYLHLPGTALALLREIDRLLAARPSPFLLLTPTRSCFTPEADGALARAGCASLALASALTVASPALPVAGRFQMQADLVPVFAGWAERLQRAQQAGGTLLSIHREIAAVRQEFSELRSAKQRLEQIQGEGLLKFAGKVDADSFRAFCAILATGDVAKASRTLALADATLRALLRRWRRMGPAYATLLDLVEWRKRMGRKAEVPFNDATFHDRAATADPEGLLADVLDGLLSMTEQNWPDLCEELTTLLRPHVKR
jgi:hypothetical protein